MFVVCSKAVRGPSPTSPWKGSIYGDAKSCPARPPTLVIGVHPAHEHTLAPADMSTLYTTYKPLQAMNRILRRGAWRTESSKRAGNVQVHFRFVKVGRLIRYLVPGLVNQKKGQATPQASLSGTPTAKNV